MSSPSSPPPRSTIFRLILLISTLASLSLALPSEATRNPYPPNTHFGHVFASNITTLSGRCTYTNFPTDSSSTNWTVLSSAYGSYYCDKTILMNNGDRTISLKVVDICPDCFPEDALISWDGFAYLYEDDETLVRRGRKFGPRWWLEEDGEDV